jgi:putative endonuclease
MSDRKQLGQDSEAHAAEYLMDLGYTLLDRNWACRTGELDLVMLDGEVIVFVEVRSVRRRYLETAQASITEKKQARVASAAETWLSRKKPQQSDYRFDVIGITAAAKSAPEIDHIEDAFAPNWAF